jgi:Domain of unknown function (DUF4397)
MRMLRWLKVLPLLLALAAFGVFATGCGTDHSQVRLVHAVSDGPSVDVAVDSKTVVTNLGFGSVSPTSGYLTVTAGTRKVEVRATGTTTDLINSSISFASGKQFTTIASGFETPPIQGAPPVAAVVLTDDNSAPSSGNVKLRIVHAAPEGGTPRNLDVYIVPPGTDISSMSATISGLAFGQASAYQTVPPASNQIIFTDPTDASKTPIINQTLTLAAGQIRTLVTLNVQGGLTIATTPLVLNDLN